MLLSTGLNCGCKGITFSETDKIKSKKNVLFFAFFFILVRKVPNFV